ncbi:hypothetical protein PAMP_021976 [Pampus punctatissimus]
MDKQNKDGYSDSRESYGLKISELLKTLAEKKSSPRCTICIDPRNISATLSVLNNTGYTYNTAWIIRSKAVLAENIIQLSSCQFKRRDHLSESLASSVLVPVPVRDEASTQEGQLQPSSLSSSNLIIFSHLMDTFKMLPSGSVSSIVELLKKQEIYPHILGVQAWTKQQSCELRCMLSVTQVSLQTGQLWCSITQLSSQRCGEQRSSQTLSNKGTKPVFTEQSEEQTQRR